MLRTGWLIRIVIVILVAGIGFVADAQDAPPSQDAVGNDAADKGAGVADQKNGGDDGAAPEEDTAAAPIEDEKKSSPPADVTFTNQTASPSEQGAEHEKPSDAEPAAPLASALQTEPVKTKIEVTAVSTARASEASPAEGESESEPAEKNGAMESPDILTGTWTKSIVFATKSGSFKFQPRGWIQPRFRLAINGNDDYNDGEPFTGTEFSFQRARFGFQAWIFKWARMYLDTGWNSRGGALIDYFLDLGPENGGGPIAVRLGFFRPYFIRQLLHATTKLAMIEYAAAWADPARSIEGAPALDLGVGPSGRQLGFGIQGFVADGFEYGVGIWNGADTFSKSDTGSILSGGNDFMGGGRIAVHPLGLAGVGNAVRPGNESDTDISDRPGLSIGGAVFLEDRDDVTTTLPPLDPYSDRQIKFGGDLAFQYRGLSLVGEVFFTRAWAEDGDVAALLESVYLDAPGVSTYFQAGYMFTKRFELLGRFDMVDENTEIRGIRFYPSLGATIFIYGNNLKVQTQYRANIGAGYEEGDVPGDPFIPVTHDLFFMVQASI